MPWHRGPNGPGPAGWRPTLILAGSAGVIAVLGLVGTYSCFDGHRYHELGTTSPIVRWALDASDERIGIVGIQLQYLFYGADLSNHVQYVGQARDDGSFSPTQDCRTRRREVNAGEYDYVITAPDLFTASTPSEQGWIETDPAVTLVLRNGFVWVFEVNGLLDPNGCSPSSG